MKQKQLITTRLIRFSVLIIFLVVQFLNSVELQAQLITTTPWRMNLGAPGFPLPAACLPMPFHGAPCPYNFAVTPPVNDPNWVNAPLNGQGQVSFVVPSTLPGGSCLLWADFTFFETQVNIPINTIINTFTVSFSQVDDGARAYIFNSAHPTGAFIAGGDIIFGGPPVTANLASLAVVGEVNRVVIAQYDDCPTGNNLIGATVNVNGTPAVICPVITCPSNISVNNTPGQCEANVVYPAATATGYPTPTITYSQASGTIFPIGTTIVTATATNSCGTVNCSFTVTVNDKQPPNAICTSTTVNLDANGAASVAATDINNGSNDNCGTVNLSVCSAIGSGVTFINASERYQPFASDFNQSRYQVLYRADELLAVGLRAGSPITSIGFNIAQKNTNTPIPGFQVSVAQITATTIGSPANDFSTAPLTTVRAAAPYTTVLGWNHISFSSPVIWDGTSGLLIQTCHSGGSNGAANTDGVFTYAAPGNQVVTGYIQNCNALQGLYTHNIVPQLEICSNNKYFNCGNKGPNNAILKVIDASDNASRCTAVVTVADVISPTITCPVTVSAARSTNFGQCTYLVIGNEFNATATDNCSVIALMYSLSGATTGTGTSLTHVNLTRGTTTVTWTATDVAGNTSTCAFDVLVTDNQNATDYIIYAEKEVSFDEYHFIGGDVGVTANNGKADFKKNTVLDPDSITAKNITVQLPSAVNNRKYSPAVGGPNPTFYPYNGNTSGLSNIDVNSNGILNGNWKDVKVKKGVIVTITGDNFGKITIEEGANVTFTASVINVKELKVEKGKKNNNVLTIVNFSNPASVKIKDKVSIEDDARVNVGGPKVTFYAGDNTGGDEKFEVKGENSQVTGNIMVPVGKLHVHGGNDVTRPIIMTGWYIIEKLDGHGKYVYWNKYTCEEENVSSFVQTTQQEIKQTPAIVKIPQLTVVDQFRVNVYPNPSAYDFSIQVLTRSNEPVTVRILDINGQVRSVQTQLSKANNIKVGKNLIGGTYFAEVTQGSNKQVVKLVKLN